MPLPQTLQRDNHSTSSPIILRSAAQRINIGVFSRNTSRLASTGRHTRNLEVVDKDKNADNDGDKEVMTDTQQPLQHQGSVISTILPRLRGTTLSTALRHLSIISVKRVIKHAKKNVKSRVLSWGISPASQKLCKSSQRGTLYQDGSDNTGGSFRVGMVAKVETLPLLFPTEDVEASLEKMPIREGEQSTIVAPSREVVVDAPED